MDQPKPNPTRVAGDIPVAYFNCPVCWKETGEVRLHLSFGEYITTRYCYTCKAGITNPKLVDYHLGKFLFDNYYAQAKTSDNIG